MASIGFGWTGLVLAGGGLVGMERAGLGTLDGVAFIITVGDIGLAGRGLGSAIFGALLGVCAILVTGFGTAWTAGATDFGIGSGTDTAAAGVGTVSVVAGAGGDDRLS